MSDANEFKLKCGFLALTYACNLRCKWCYARPAEFDSHLMDFGRAEKYLELMAELSAADVGFIGGEPLLHPHALDLVSHCAGELGLRATLYSNGVLLADEKTVEKVASAGASCVNVSVQAGAAGAAKHDETVGVNGAWEKTRRGIENCFDAGIPLVLQTVLTHTNLGAYEGLLDEFAFTAARFVFYREIPSDIGCTAMFEHDVLSNEETRDAFNKIYAHAKSRGLRAYLFSRMPLCWFRESDALEKELRERVVSHCHAINGRNLIIGPRDEVLPCATFVNLPSMSMLKNERVLSKEEFLREWLHGEPARIREKLKYYPCEDCKHCEEFGLRCTGGCPLIKFDKPNANEK